MSFTYQVIARGLMFDKIHEPNGKHSTVTVETKFKKCPSWLKLITKKPAAKKGQPSKSSAKDTAPKGGKVQKVKNIKDVKMNPEDETDESPEDASAPTDSASEEDVI